MSLLHLGPPPLPEGWTEHIGPGGQVYYHNQLTRESTYIRPLPPFSIPPPSSPPKAKKEKPLLKTKIPGTDWLRVKTTEGNVFYSHKVKKESVWTVPEEIKDAVQALQERENEEQSAISHEEVLKQAETERFLETERIKSEVQEMVKRKAEEFESIEEVMISKKVRIEEDNKDDDSDESEEWQREAASQLAAEAALERQRVEQEAEMAKEMEETKEREISHIHMPERVDLSLEEAKALFKTLLREKDIDPLHPWDTSLPKFVSDPRYVLLPSVSVRREAFDEYCRDRAREIRQSKVKKDKDVAKPQEEYERLLREEVKSTRATWTDFRRTWKKDRRFYTWGRDDREREKKFREHIRELGERKRAAAKKAEADFFSLLRERIAVKEDCVWTDVKHQISDDPRYDAVGSSSLRQELFSTFLKASESASAPVPESTTEGGVSTIVEDEQKVDAGEAEAAQRSKERKHRAVKEREEKVRAERERLGAQIDRSRVELYREEGEREFMSMLTDAVRDPQISWEVAVPQLKIDSRFRNSRLSLNQQLQLFHNHVERLHSKNLDNLLAAFELHAPSLADPFSSLPLSSLLSSQPVVKLGFNIHSLEHEFEKWQRERTADSRKAFDQMLTENSFVEFWGRLSKIGGEGVNGGIKVDDLDEDGGEGGDGMVDMKALAKNVDVQEMEKVLKNDKRYIMFDHVPNERERWIRDYLSQLSAPKLSVHVQQSG